MLFWREYTDMKCVSSNRHLIIFFTTNRQKGVFRAGLGLRINKDFALLRFFFAIFFRNFFRRKNHLTGWAALYTSYQIYSTIWLDNFCNFTRF